MNKNLGWKLVVIAGISAASSWSGIFGIPKDWSGKGILAAITERIHLGLDLAGGTHLILQVQVNDAVNVDPTMRLRVSRKTCGRTRSIMPISPSPIR